MPCRQPRKLTPEKYLRHGLRTSLAGPKPSPGTTPKERSLGKTVQAAVRTAETKSKDSEFEA